MNFKVCKVIFAAAAASVIALSAGICTNAASPAAQPAKTNAVTVNQTLKIQAELSSSVVYEGDSVTAAASVSGGNGNYSYLFECIDKDTGSTVFSQKSSVSEYSFTLSQAGDYKLVISAEDETGLKESIEKDLTVETVLPLNDNGTVLDRKRVLPGKYVNAIAKFKGGVKPYQYKCILSDLNMNKVIYQSDYADNPVMRIQIPDGVSSFYRVYVMAKDSRGTIKSTFCNIYSYNKSSEPLSLEKSSVNLSETGKNGYVRINSIAEGGTAPYRYIYSFEDETGNWNFPDKTYVYSSSTSLRMPSEYGKYTLRVGVKDMDGNYTEKTFPVEVKELDLSGSTISAEKPFVGEKITVKGISKYAEGTVQYQFSYHERNKDWVYTTGYSFTQTHSFKFDKAGIYTVRVSAKDKLGNGTYKEKIFSVSISELNVSNSTVNKTTVKQNEKVTITSRVYNNNGAVKYHYSYHAEGKPWTYIGDYKTAATQQFSFADPGIYYIRVGVKDKNGTGIYKEKQFKITVTGPAMFEDQKKFLDQARTYIGKDGAYVCKTKLGMPYVLDWCCFSVSAIMKDCGFIPQYQLDVYGVAPFPARYGDGITGTWFMKGEKTPQPGDLIFFKSSSCPIVDKYSCSHIGIVESVEGDKITTLEGNVDGGWDWAETSTYARKIHYISDTYVHSFFHINWKK